MMPYLTLNCNGKLFSLEKPAVMGIVNINSDSFYDFSRAKVTKDVMIKVESMIENGARIIDIGALGSRPGSSTVSPEDEWTRMEEILPVLRKNFQKHIITVDTVQSASAQNS